MKCLACEHRQRPCSGPCVCLIDPERRDITVTHRDPPTTCPHYVELKSAAMARAAIDPDYTPTPANATRGRCCS